MAAPIPAEFGGGRQLIADPDASGVTTITGDLAALNLQLIYVLVAIIPEKARPLIDQIAAGTRFALASSDAG